MTTRSATHDHLQAVQGFTTGLAHGQPEHPFESGVLTVLELSYPDTLPDVLHQTPANLSKSGS